MFTLIVPRSMGIHTEVIPLSFTVNTATPLYSVALLTECGQMGERGKALTLLVERWARVRGISHAVIGAPRAGYMGTPRHIFISGRSVILMLAHGFLHTQQQAIPLRALQTPRPPVDGPADSVAVLFIGFVSFYMKSFNWQRSRVDPSGRRAPSNLSRPLHVVVSGIAYDVTHSRLCTGAADNYLRMWDLTAARRRPHYHAATYFK